MRTFYIFKIKRELANLTKESPYNIYKNMEQIKRQCKRELNVCQDIYDQIIVPLDINSINKKLLDLYKDNIYYQKYYNTHSIYNKYRPEKTELLVKNSYIILKTDYPKPSFLSDLMIDKDFFVCDFDNRDYFWIEQMMI